MNVLLINGSPHPQGCTFTALSEVAAELEKQGIGSRFFQLGTKPVAPCLSCGACARTGQCVQKDMVNEFLAIVPDYDGFVFGTPVHFAAASGQITTFMDRVFFAGRDLFANKPCASVVSCRRGGAVTAFDQINRYFTIRNAPIVPSLYWNMVHGTKPADVKQDLEGLLTMRQLARNMAWMLKCFQAGKEAGIPLPATEPAVNTNFIR